MKRAIAIAASVVAAAFAAPALAQSGTNGDNGRHCGTTRGHHKGWIHHPKTHKTGRGCPAAHQSDTSKTTASGDDQNATGQDVQGEDDTQGKADDAQGDDNDAQGDDDSQDSQDD